MTLYYYQAMTEKGKMQKGIIDAFSVQDASDKLQGKSLLLIHITQAQEQSRQICLSLKERILFFGGISRLLRAGLPLYDALLVLEEKFVNSKSGALFTNLCERIKSGWALSEALANYPESFDLMVLSMIANAEKSGNLAETLEEIVALFSKQRTLKKQVLSSLMYPCILFVFSFFVMGVLLLYVVPSLFELFEGKKLHPLTLLVLQISRILNEYKIFIFGILIISCLFLGVVFIREKFRKKFFSYFFCLSFFNKIFMKTALIRFCRAFASLLEGGVSYIEAVKLAASVMNHPFLEKQIKGKAQELIEGKKLSDLFLQIPQMPSLLSRMVAIAEQSGEMSKMLYYLSQIYEEELEKTLAQITSLLQPVMLLLLGVLVGFVVLSVLLPLTDVSSFIGT